MWQRVANARGPYLASRGKKLSTENVEAFGPISLFAIVPRAPFTELANFATRRGANIGI